MNKKIQNIFFPDCKIDLAILVDTSGSIVDDRHGELGDESKRQVNFVHSQNIIVSYLCIGGVKHKIIVAKGIQL